MARPIKHGLDYFPFDVDFFSDEKIVAISGEFGIKGEITAIKLLCAVYRNGYFIEWSEMLKFKMLKELPGVSAELLEQIIKRLVKWDFFDKALFDSASILTSRGIQRRYQAICSKMHRKNMITQYNLLVSKTPSVVTIQAHTSPKPKAKKAVTSQKRISLLDSIQQMSQDEIWKEAIMQLYKIESDDLFNKKLSDFKDYCLSLDKHDHSDIKDAKQHFSNIMKNGVLDNISNSKKQNHEERPKHLRRHIASADYQQRQGEVIDFVVKNIGRD